MGKGWLLIAYLCVPHGGECTRTAYRGSERTYETQRECEQAAQKPVLIVRGDTEGREVKLRCERKL